MTDPIRVRDMERLVLRIPPALRELLETRAKINERSMNAEAAAILEQALDASPSSLINRALTHYHRYTRQLSNTEERRKDLIARQNAVRSAIVELMPDERAAEALIRGYEAERAKEEGQNYDVDPAPPTPAPRTLHQNPNDYGGAKR
jgi:plasmid stability protein